MNVLLRLIVCLVTLSPLSDAYVMAPVSKVEELGLSVFISYLNSGSATQVIWVKTAVLTGVLNVLFTLRQPFPPHPSLLSGTFQYRRNTLT